MAFRIDSPSSTYRVFETAPHMACMSTSTKPSTMLSCSNLSQAISSQICFPFVACSNQGRCFQDAGINEALTLCLFQTDHSPLALLVFNTSTTSALPERTFREGSLSSTHCAFRNSPYLAYMPTTALPRTCNPCLEFSPWTSSPCQWL